MYYNKVANGNADIYQLEIYEGLAEEAQSLLTKGMQVHVGGESLINSSLSNYFPVKIQTPPVLESYSISMSPGRLRLDNYVDRNQIPRISPVIEVTEVR